MSETLQPLGQWDTAIDKDGDLWVSPDGLGWAKFVRRGHGVTFHPRDVAAYGLARTPIPPEPTGLGATVRDVDGDLWARTREGRWLALIPGGGKRTWDDVATHGPLTVVSEGVES